MSKTSIEWTDRTWNPTRGCSRVSEGCRNCYAERQAARFARPSDGYDINNGPFYGFVQKANSHPQWTGRVELIESKLMEPLSWRKPARVFVNSMSDLFHEALPFKQIARIVRVMQEAQWHTYQVLTKRAIRMLEFSKWWNMQTTDPLPRNLWLGVSVEDQKTADERIPLLLQTPAAVRFVSYEPALGAVDFRFDTEYPDPDGCYADARHGLDQIIVGGESGPGARPFDIAWVRNTIAQCKAAGVACFVKQLGANPLEDNDPKGPYPAFHHELLLKDRKGGDMYEWPEELRIREFPKQWSDLMGTAMRDADEDAERYLRGDSEPNPRSTEPVQATDHGGCKTKPCP